MTQTNDATTPSHVQVGDRFHAPSSGLTISERPAWGLVLERGRSYVVSREMLQANLRPDGSSVLDLLDDEPRQVTVFGEVKLRRGPFPADEVKADPGTRDWALQREQARRAAHMAPTDELRAAALRAVEERFGPAAPTSTTTATYASDVDLWARRDAERREAEQERRRGR